MFEVNGVISSVCMVHRCCLIIRYIKEHLLLSSCLYLKLNSGISFILINNAHKLRGKYAEVILEQVQVILELISLVTDDEWT